MQEHDRSLFGHKGAVHKVCTHLGGSGQKRIGVYGGEGGSNTKSTYAKKKNTGTKTRLLFVL